MRKIGLLGLISLLPLSSMNCDNTVALDTTLPSLTSVYVSSACPAESDLTTLDLSLVLLNQGNSNEESDNLLPTSRVKRESKTVGELLTTSAFQFNRPTITDTIAPQIMTTAYVTLDNDARDHKPVSLQSVDINFDFTGNDELREKETLVILLMDQSGSLFGKYSDVEAPNFDQATDFKSERITFFKQFVKNLPSDYYVSLISFKERFSSLNDEDSETNIPTQNRELINERLEELRSSNEKGVGTPLIEALVDAKKLIDQALTGKDYKPIIILFTDGVESGDTSPSNETLEGMSLEFKRLNIPVHVVELQPPAAIADDDRRGYDLDLSLLACQTGGDYLLVKQADEFTKSNSLEPILLNRMVGRWKLRIQSDLVDNDVFPPNQGYLLSTDLQVTLGGQTRAYSMSFSGVEATNDQRLWIFKN